MRHAITIVSILSLLCPVVALALVNINTASLSELDTLPGVGPATAEKIIAARPFSAASDIQNVAGIGGPGSSTYENIIGLITVSGVTTVEVEEEESDDEETVTTTTKKDNDAKVYLPVNGLNLKAPDIAYVNQPISLHVEPQDGRKERLVHYRWNFGDGNTADISSPTHTYKYPGTYVIVVESTHLKEEKVARREIEVLRPSLTVSHAPAGAITVTNNGEHEIDLHGMSLGGGFVFEEHSFILPGKSVTIGPKGDGFNNQGIRDQSGVLVSKVEAPSTPLRTAPRSNTVAAVSVSSPPPTTEAVVKEGPVPPVVENTAAVANATVPENAWPYLGLFALMAFGLFSVFGTTLPRA